MVIVGKNKKELGQVFTSAVVADFMTGMLDLDSDARIFDPCFGDGAFLAALSKRGFTNVSGCEIDTRLHEYCREKYPQFNLRCKDFLREDSGRLFDGIIVNPPYIRHQRIDDLAGIGITRSSLRENPLFAPITLDSNLYMYFLVKAISMLAPGGQLVAIFPDSWLFSDSATTYKETLLAGCQVERKVKISGDVFLGSVSTSVMIVKFIRQARSIRPKEEELRITEGKLTRRNTHEPLQLGFNASFPDIGSIKVGLKTGYNKMFLNPDFEGAEAYCVPIISSPKQMEGFSTNGAFPGKLLAIRPGDKLTPAAKNYLNVWKKKILSENYPKEFSCKMRADSKWYVKNPAGEKSVLFGYIIQNRMRFFDNQQGVLATSNLYALTPKIDHWLFFALLNSYYTFYQLEAVQRTYGGGMLKIQVFDFDSLTFPDPEAISPPDRERLAMLGRKLAKSGDENALAEISEVVSRYSVVSLDDLVEGYHFLVSRRLG
ncbi:N-6 DNA Methylase [Varibaculum cambriense]|uniref:site-specific DNA-methyltransferase (adenine-specific) n=1 Tax=Varibaculum cambriense TaxID=184870 RepID=A0AB34X0K2_9ACTO|nr:N-6 DNA Methylase [Varibaculum cambriense]